MSLDVFLSHSHVDKVFADAICHRLEAADIRCWVAPRDIRPSEDWAEAIINAMDQARMLVLIFSASSNSSPQVRREVERAVNKGLMVLPFRIENVPLSKSLEYFISTQHWLDAITGDLEDHLTQLCSSVAMLLERLPPAAASPQPGAPPAFGTQPSAANAPPQGMPAAAIAPAIAPAVLAAIEQALAQELGPIARHLVRRALLAAPSRQQLVAALAQEIDDSAERQRFVARCHAAG
ncbi:toll/interleukin-1 receptor domain-containing protein [Duganella sp. BJB488]|uniref:toll/interleukin-1 receptor domain-containing protein n=1 Tax=unclassified Duganella TaxID=2636909 RepID=UPI000E3506DE|nr:MULTISPECIES: toll/interleukin-1 receptor domain-containing protein [unclassified Duganella]RFP08825.1 toll/interleukin-1 receptor domain-containing protein [Duganella sp. BJB489]RFP11555.1 toll/interleukin-1 receptor domain-containing protein [Duganella sp. BJB488]RFP28554.1 toll/interleukin-1 receptor domain-containing protein [Duganella sp. BJB480]